MDFSRLNASLRNSLVYKSFDFSLNLKPNILNDSFKANSSTPKNATNEASIEEKKAYEKVFTQKVDKKVLDAERGMTTIYFRDPITQKLTRSALSTESLSRLGQEFDQKELTRRNDGSYILSGKAENFIAGWYADIAYARGYLAADKDKDGYFSTAELENTRGGFTLNGFKNAFGEEFLNSFEVKSYMSLALEDVQSFKNTTHTGEYGSKTIGLELDRSLKNDKNFDGKITYEESGAIEAEFGDETIESEDELFVSLRQIIKLFSGGTETLDLKIKDVLDKLDKGVKYDELEEAEKSLLKMNLAQELFDERKAEDGTTYLEFNEGKFKSFYENFVQSFKLKSAKFLGLSANEASKLDYEKLSTIVKELNTTMIQTNSTSLDDVNAIMGLKKVDMIV
ncbi:hypothetical protein DMB95_00665 [Campylobacter sp. MIT 12-8780]|uniref:hypothetical protein n=1 Tax=unclassified Campylobacter TaxID=2593542 RepID=UPI00115DB674|nr:MULTISPECIES: hypothetical protein [unclassified Campylobacter]NDJ26474.1 hypothetical protein [Campylobacter sp. MIT 19-121]TQR43044.1 hypothetical protein DMB95_00665 [Campylobacter sp. MIT 12-8780]